jgi:hypothetical protein
MGLTNMNCQQTALGAVSDGFYIKPTAEAYVGKCKITYIVSNSDETYSSSTTWIDEINWRFKKIKCDPKIDTDGGGASDCQEYEDRTNPASASDDIKSDTTAPTITLDAPINGGTVNLGSTANASYTCQDEAGGSDLASCTSTVANGAALDTATVGTKTFTITATDNAGNSKTETGTYTVTYQHSGFLGPINSNEVNKAKAGATVPVQFRLLDGAGNPITTASSFVSLTSAGTTCSAGEPSDAIEQYSGGSGLQYLGDGYWQYNWKTSKSYAGQCRIIYLNLADGSKASAKFQF